MEKVIGITMDNIAGVGPELILKVIKDYPNALIYGSNPNSLIEAIKIANILS